MSVRWLLLVAGWSVGWYLLWRVPMLRRPGPAAGAGAATAGGGPDLDVLYVTSAKLRKLTEPMAGALFALDVGVRGLPLPFFKG